MIWILVSLIVLFSGLWFLKVPSIIHDGDQWNQKFVPIGLNVWKLIVLIIISVIPVINIVAFATMIWGLVDSIIDHGINNVFGGEWLFKNTKLYKFLNKDIGKSKN